jgi:hypothetical protein
MGSHYGPVREYTARRYEVKANPDRPEPDVTGARLMLDPRRAITSVTHHMGILLAVVAICAAWAAASPAVAPAAAFKVCPKVRVDLGVIDALVSARNTSCEFARGFVRRHRRELCSMSQSTISGWRKSIVTIGEGLTCTTLRKGSRQIATNACSA